jgi:hypothetical protein
MSRTVGLPTRTMGVHRAWLSPTRLPKSLPWAGIALEQPFSILRNPPLIAHQLPSAYGNPRGRYARGTGHRWAATSFWSRKSYGFGRRMASSSAATARGTGSRMTKRCGRGCSSWPGRFGRRGRWSLSRSRSSRYPASAAPAACGGIAGMPGCDFQTRHLLSHRNCPSLGVSVRKAFRCNAL